MGIYVNGTAHDVPAGCTVAGLLSLLEIKGKRVAVAINRDVIPRSTHEDVSVEDGDEVEILEAVGGG